MCLALHLITKDSLSESEWVEDAPCLWVKRIRESEEQGELKWNSHAQFVYYIGGYQGCGCGWSPFREWDEPEEHAQKQADRLSLVQLLQELSDRSSWMVICWEGDQGTELLEPKAIRLDEIKDVGFEFEEKRKYVII